MAQLHENPEVCYVLLGYSILSTRCLLVWCIIKMSLALLLTYILHNDNSEIKLEEAAVLHFTYSKFSDLTSRRDRCGCKPTKEDVKRCFMLDFDRTVSFLHSLSFLDFLAYYCVPELCLL